MPRKDKEATRLYNKKYREENREKVLSGQLDWYYRHHEQEKAKMSDNQKTWRRSNPEEYLWKNAKERAIENMLDFTIEVSDVLIPTHCPVFGVEMSIGGDRETSPSLDRVNNSLGYVKGNVRVISFRANRLKSNSTSSELRAIADWMDAQ